MKEIELLIKKAERYIKSAEILLKEEDYESCVSRIYYAMFYVAQSVLLSNDLSFSSHKATISAFGNNFVKTGIFPKNMGRNLSKAFEKRQIGDYGYTFMISEDDAKDMLTSGKEFIETIIQYLSENGYLAL